MIEEKDVIALEDVKKEILEFCLEAKPRTAIVDHFQETASPENCTRFVRKLLSERFIKTSLLDKRSTRNEKYIITQKGLNYLKAIA